MPTTAAVTYSEQKLEPYLDPESRRTISVALGASLSLARGTVLGEKIGTNSKQRISITGAPTGGTFTLTFGAATTAAIAYGASREVVQAALEALATVGNGNVAVTGGWNAEGATFDVEFVGALAAAAQGAITCSVASLTGGVPAESVTSLQTGVAGTPGVFAAYNKANTDGTQIAKCVLVYDVQTDASGNITISATAGQSGGQWGETYKSIEAAYAGTYRCADLVGLDSTAVSQLGHLIQGTVASGILRMP